VNVARAVRRLLGRPEVPPEQADAVQLRRYSNHLAASRRLRELEQGLKALQHEARLIEQADLDRRS
jgi:hypothetical protein